MRGVQRLGRSPGERELPHPDGDKPQQEFSLRLTTKGTVRYVGLLRPGRQIDLAMQLDRPLRRSRHGTESAGI